MGPVGSQGMSDEIWWFHLYVMLSRATRMKDMLLLRPPPRELLERGPPSAILPALERFVDLERRSAEDATRLCAELGLQLPDDIAATVAPARRRLTRKMAPTASESHSAPFMSSSTFTGRKTQYHFKCGPQGLGYYYDPHVEGI